MLRLLAVAVLVAGVVCDSEPAEARSREHHYENDDHLYLQAKLDGDRPAGPVIARSLHSKIGHGPDIAAQDEIIRDVYSPTYYEPLWVLDYRFLKSGGRKYVRGPGGQVLILPKSYKGENDDARDYDSLIEHLRLKMLADHRKREKEQEPEEKYEQRRRDNVDYQRY